MGDQFPFPIMPRDLPYPSSASPNLPSPRRPSPDRQFACAPFFVPPLEAFRSHAPLRIRGGAGGRPRRTNKAPPSSSSRRLEVPSTSRVKTRSSRASPLTDLDKLKIEETAVRTEVNRLNLSLRDVEGDGNCLFRALSDQLYGDQKRHPEMRKLTCDYLETHEADLGYWAKLCSFLDGEDYALYVKRMRKSGQYASEVEVHAAARLLRRDIRIVHSDHSETIPWAFDPSSVPMASPVPEPAETVPEPSQDAPSTPGPRRRTRSSTTSLLQTPAAPPPSSPLYASALQEYLPPVRDGRSMLWLALFNDAEHYQSVRRKGDRERAPAEVEDRLALPHEKDRSESARIARGELPAPAATAAKSTPSNASLVLASLPAGHAFSPDYVNGILARVKGDIGAAVEILLEEMDTLSDIIDVTDSDGRVEQMLIDPAEEPHVIDHAIPSEPIRDTKYREPSSSLAAVAHPLRPHSPSGSSITTADASNTSESDDVSHSSIATTPSTSSLQSTRSTRSSSGGSKSKTVKPYDRPSVLPGRRKGKELSKELEELKMGADSVGREGKIEQERRKSIEEQGERRKSQLDELRAARGRQKLKA